MARLFDSWRSTPTAVDSRRSGSEATVRRSRAESRIAAMHTSDLVDFIDANLGGIGRGVRDWRSTASAASLYEAGLAADIMVIAVQELIRRNPG